MKFSYDWLNEYFENKLPNPQEVADTLTFHSFEVEDVTKSGTDTIFDVDVLPNRAADCFSHRGVAKELSVLLGIDLSRDPLRRSADLSPKAEDFSVSIGDRKLCSRYSAAVMKGVKVRPSPDWLARRVENLGLQTVNNVVDATNYVMLNTGQPLHAFDFSKLTGEKKGIGVRVAQTGEKISVLGGGEHELPEGTIMITDKGSNEAIGIAGIKGGASSGVDSSTNQIVIEAAHFDPVRIRRASRALKLQTDASLRFQNNISPELTAYALKEATELIAKIAGGAIAGFADECSETQKQQPVEVSTEDFNSLTGLSLTEHDIAKILDRLGFSYKQNDKVFSVTPSFERRDILGAEDLVEEIARVYGYENVKGEDIPPAQRKVEVNKRFFYTEKIKDTLVGLGFSEVYTYMLTPQGEIALANPLAEDKSYLRTSLAVGLRTSLLQNANNAPVLNAWKAVRIFEVGPVWSNGKEHLSLGLAIRSLVHKKKTSTNDMLRRAINAIQEALDVDLQVSLSLPSGDFENFEIFLDKAIENLPEPKEQPVATHPQVSYERPSPYPFVLRDIALWVPKNISTEAVLREIRDEAGELLIRHSLFDEFKKEGRVSYAFHLVFQSNKKTLTDDEVNEIMGRVESRLTKKGWKVR